MAGVRMPGGYLQVTITANRSPTGKQLKAYVHRMVCEAFYGPQPEGMEVRHRDGDNSNNTVENLCWGTPKQNAGDRKAHGTGSGWRLDWRDTKRTRTTLELVEKIKRASSEGGLTQHQIAKAFGVSQSIVSRALRGALSVQQD